MSMKSSSSSEDLAVTMESLQRPKKHSPTNPQNRNKSTSPPPRPSIDTRKQQNTYSIRNLMQQEVRKILGELNIPMKELPQEDMDLLLEKCIQERVMILKDDGTEMPLSQCSAENCNRMLVMDIAIEMCDHRDENNAIAKNFRKLEDRIGKLERCYQSLQIDLKRIQRERIGCRLDKNAIRNDVLKMLRNFQLPKANIKESNKVLKSLAGKSTYSKITPTEIINPQSNDPIPSDLPSKSSDESIAASKSDEKANPCQISTLNIESLKAAAASINKATPVNNTPGLYTYYGVTRKRSVSLTRPSDLPKIEFQGSMGKDKQQLVERQQMIFEEAIRKQLEITANRQQMGGKKTSSEISFRHLLDQRSNSPVRRQSNTATSSIRQLFKLNGDIRKSSEIIFSQPLESKRSEETKTFEDTFVQHIKEPGNKDSVEAIAKKPFEFKEPLKKRSNCAIRTIVDSRVLIKKPLATRDRKSYQPLGPLVTDVSLSEDNLDISESLLKPLEHVITQLFDINAPLIKSSEDEFGKQIDIRNTSEECFLQELKELLKEPSESTIRRRSTGEHKDSVKRRSKSVGGEKLPAKEALRTEFQKKDEFKESERKPAERKVRQQRSASSSSRPKKKRSNSVIARQLNKVSVGGEEDKPTTSKNAETESMAETHLRYKLFRQQISLMTPEQRAANPVLCAYFNNTDSLKLPAPAKASGTDKARFYTLTLPHNWK